jgi:hypothetical protein
MVALGELASSHNAIPRIASRLFAKLLPVSFAVKS